MSWVKYSKDSQKHEAAKKVKRDLIKLAKRFPNYIEIFITVTGFESQDISTLKFYERDTYRKLVNDINRSIKDNEEHGYDGFYYTQHLSWITFIKELSEIRKYIFNNYCKFEVSKK